MNRTRFFSLSIMSICVIAGCSSNNSEQSSNPTLNWLACSDNAQLECATLDVPRDYQEPSAGTIELSLRRNRAPEATRKGTLLVHLGGQGAAADAVDDLVNGEDYNTPTAIVDEFDLVGFDPRGSGGSTAIDCTAFFPAQVNIYPTVDEDFRMLESTASQLASDCYGKYGDYLLNIGSQAAVQDMEQIRKALGEEKLNFLGVSFGTRMGSLYLQNYPENSGNFVLDASASPDSSLRLMGAAQIAQMQMNLETLLSNCDLVDPGCNAEELIGIADTRMDNLIAENAGREFDLFLGLLVFAADLSVASEVISPLVDYLQNRDLVKLEEDIGEIYDEFADFVTDTNLPIDIAVLCADDAIRPDSDSLIRDLTELNQVSNIYAEYIIRNLISTCIGWPQAVNPVPPITTNTAPQSLIIGGTTDQFTPLQASRDMATAIGGYLIESAHGGHDIVFRPFRGTECVDSAVTEFLRTGNLPAVNECPARE